MGAFIFSSANRIEPLTISVKKVGDPRERFLTRNGNTISFDEDSGEAIAYEVKITDSASPPRVSTSIETLSCQRPTDCQYGPFLEGIVEFNANQLTYQFNGVDVTQIERQIIANGIIVDMAIDIPSGPVVTTTFAGSLANGNYTLKLRGKSCYSELTNGIEFTITDDSTDLDWWPNYPRFDYDTASETYRILMAVTRAGTYPYAIKDSLGDTIISGFYTLSPGQILDFVGYEPDTYDLELGPLTATLVIDAPPAECDNGPELLSVTSNSPIQTQFNFDGLNVEVIEWFIRTTSDVIEQQGTVEPGGSTVTINHQPLSGGTHNLYIRGSSCTSEAGVVDNLDFAVAGSALTINSVNVTQLADGRYRLAVSFSGGSPNYTVTVRSLSNATIGSFPNVTGSPANVTLPSGTAPQTVKVMVMDVLNAVDEETSVILAAPVMTMNFMQAANFITVPTRTPMDSDGAIYFIGDSADFNWDVEAVLPNGGLWDYIEKRLRKRVSGVWVEKSISAATSNPQNYSVPPSSSSERLFLPRTGSQVVIDGQNVFKTAGEWEFRAIARKGGIGGAIVSQLTRNYTVSAPPTLSGIFLYNRTSNVLGSEIAQINSIGSSFSKPVPAYDLVVKDFNGAGFNKITGAFRQKVGDQYISRHTISKEMGSTMTTVPLTDFSLFWTPFSDYVYHSSINAQESQTWEIEFIGYMGSTAIGTKKAVFNFTVGASSFVNSGFKNSVVNGKKYQQRQGLDFGSEILPTGNVKIYYPATRQSINGQKTCYAWPYLNHVRIDPSELAELKGGSGKALVPGIYEFSIKYHSNVVADYDDIVDGGTLGNAYFLAGEQTNISYANSAMDDYFTVTIRPA